MTTPHGQPLPDFSIPHQEKIDWMVETTGWAIEPVPAQTDTDPPVPGYAYTISFPETFGFPEVLVFGLTPVAARGLLGLVADCLRGGTEIPVGVEVVGLLDNDLRCIFAPIDLDGVGPVGDDGDGMASWPAIRDGATALARPERIPALRGGVRCPGRATPSP